MLLILLLIFYWLIPCSYYGCWDWTWCAWFPCRLEKGGLFWELLLFWRSFYLIRREAAKSPLLFNNIFLISFLSTYFMSKFVTFSKFNSLKFPSKNIPTKKDAKSKSFVNDISDPDALIAAVPDASFYWICFYDINYLFESWLERDWLFVMLFKELS